MTTIWIVDREGTTAGRCAHALQAEGWQVRVSADPTAVDQTASAVVLAGDLGWVPRMKDRAELAAVPVVLVTSLDRSGWDRTFQDEAAFSVDALLDLPVDAEALVKRLHGIFAARVEAGPEPPQGDFREIIQRAIASEEAAEKFYAGAAAASRVTGTREVLTTLAAEEREHKQMLLGFLEGTRSLPTARTAPTSVMETFGTPELTPELSPPDAFLLAARKEKLAVDFYTNWAALYPEGPERTLLLQLAEVERRHKQRVEEMFVNASFPEDFHE